MKMFCLIVMGLAASAASGRTWTSTTGSQLEADYVGIRNNTVSLRKADGKAFEIGMQFLSEADRAFVSDQKAKATAATPAATATANATSPVSSTFGNTGPIRKDLLTEDEIAALKTEMPGKDENVKYLFTANFTQRHLEGAELKKLKAGQIPYRVTVEFMEISVVKGKSVAKRMPGYVRFYVLDDEGKPVVSRRDSLEKMCPT